MPPRFRELMLALLLAFVSLQSAVAQTRVITKASEFRELSRDELVSGMPVKMRGHVTYCRGSEYPDFILQDATGGVFADLKQGEMMAGDLQLGQEVEIEGVTTVGYGLPPRVSVTRFQRGDSVSKLEPIHLTPAAVAGGAGYMSYVEFTGIIREAYIDPILVPPRLILNFGPPENRLTVRMARVDDASLATFVPDATVKVKGVALTWATPSLQSLAYFVVANDPSQIELVSAPPPPAEQKPTPLQELLSSHPQDFEARREMIQGVVTLHWPEEWLIVQDGEMAVRVAVKAGNHANVGDKVKVRGFPHAQNGHITLTDIDVETLSAGSPPPPEQVDAHALLSGAYKIDRDAKRIQLSAWVTGVSTRDNHPMLQLEANGTKFAAVLPAHSQVPTGVVENAAVDLTGACKIIYGPLEQHHIGSIKGFEIHLASASGITLLSRPPILTVKRIAVAMGILLAILGVCLLWVLMLRRQVEERSKQLTEEIEARHNTQLVAAERSRLAADLHDTLSQTLSGASYQLEAAESFGCPPETAENISLVRILLDRGREDLRRAVWDLTPRALVEGNLETALRSVAAELAAYHDCEIIVRSNGTPCNLPDRTRSHLFRIGQEAMYNAVRHGNPKNVLVSLTWGEGNFALTISDDGTGFDPKKVSGPPQGHFGLSSMRDRALRVGGTFDIESNPQGTRLSVTVPI